MIGEDELLFFSAAVLGIESEDDRSFIEELYKRYYKYMFFKAWCNGCVFSDAEDVVSDAIVALIPHINTLRGLCAKALKAYIAKTTVRIAIVHIDKKRKRGHIDVDIGDLEDIQSEDPEVDNTLIRECNITGLRRAMNKLKPSDREILCMKYFESLDTEQIAEVLHIAPVTVRSKLSRARSRLYVIVKEQQADE